MSSLKGTPNPVGVICADCSDPDVTWISLNRGVYLCTECCSIHRSLGRHISWIRPLRFSHNSLNCPPIQLALVQTLHTSGANNVWEHYLLDPTTSMKYRRKPNLRDPLYPSKADFIRSKYADLAFALKPDISVLVDDDSTGSPCSDADELNKQLYSCVRTNYVETTLRLLAQGADPCGYVDHATGLTPMHVAAKEGQDLQVELMYLYGADVSRPDNAGLLPYDHAINGNFNDLAKRLLELQYDITDRMALYLCGRKPDHSFSTELHQHFVVPESVVVASLQALDAHQASLKSNRRRLASLSDGAFEKLMQDLFDEIDRRELDIVWTSHLSEDAFMTGDRYVAPFLPVNWSLPSIRNQYRQKLAKLGQREFAALCLDTLTEAKRRCCGGPSGAKYSSTSIASSTTTAPKSASTVSSVNPKNSFNAGKMYESVESAEIAMSNVYDAALKHESDGPVYDLVASDHEDSMIQRQNVSNKEIDLKTTDDALETQLASSTPVTLEEYLELKSQLAAAEALVEEMQHHHSHSSKPPLPSEKFAVDDSHSKSSIYVGTRAQATASYPVLRSASLNVLGERSSNDVKPSYTTTNDLLNEISSQNKNSIIEESEREISTQRDDNVGGGGSGGSDYLNAVPQFTSDLVVACVEAVTSRLRRLFDDANRSKVATLAAHAAQAAAVVESTSNAARIWSSTTSINPLTVRRILEALHDVTVVCDDLSTVCVDASTSNAWNESLADAVAQAAHEVASKCKALLALAAGFS